MKIGDLFELRKIKKEIKIVPIENEQTKKIRLNWIKKAWR